MAAALRDQQVKDGTISFSFKELGSDAEGFSGQGAFATGRASTNIHEKIDIIGRSSSSAELVVVDQDAYFRSGSAADASGATWRKGALADVGAPGTGVIGTLVLDSIMFTRLDEISEASTLAGSSISEVSGRPATEYRLTASTKDLLEKSSGRLGAEFDADGYSGANAPISLTLVVDAQRRLQTATWSTTSAGKKVTSEYTFLRWGEPVDIVAPL